MNGRMLLRATLLILLLAAGFAARPAETAALMAQSLSEHAEIARVCRRNESFIAACREIGVDDLKPGRAFMAFIVVMRFEAR